MRDFKEFDITYLNGVGPQKAKLFNKLNIYNLHDLLHFYPRTYEDWTITKDICDLEMDETAVVRAIVLSTPSELRISGGRVIYRTMVADDTADMKLTYFNNKFIVNLLKRDEMYYFRGKVSGNQFNKEMLNPEFLPEKKIVPMMSVYSLTAGMTSKQISKCVAQVLTMLPQTMFDCIPTDIRQKFRLCDINYALKTVHFPKSEEDYEIAKRRLIFEELFILQIGMRKIKDKNKSYTSYTLQNDYSDEFQKLLPFELTGAQKRAIKDCIEDMHKIHPMNRLLQGDVGSGKTAVAAALCHTIVKNGIQCALMAPTEILATQHYNSFKDLLEPVGVKVALLTGTLTAKQKREIYAKLEIGEIDLIIGTHALITDKVQFKNLGLVITDEQHRFGVKQRAALHDKGNNPHTLVMSATPIPRTLALMVYGELDVSVLNELPPGRQVIETYHISTDKRLRAFKYIQKHIDEGRQGYIICPLIEEGVSELANINQYYEFLIKHFNPADIGILHGKMKAKDKEDIMQKFKENEIKLLLSTTVVEVGVDVPNAVIMLIENSEMYGLSQLHQLRGRVGRGKHKSTCILVSDAVNEEATQRMEIMKSSVDGFKIAEADLKMRGPGDFFGKKQHGLPDMKIANIAKDMHILNQAREAAEEVLERDPYLSESEELLKEVKYLFKMNNENMIL